MFLYKIIDLNTINNNANQNNLYSYIEKKLSNESHIIHITLPMICNLNFKNITTNI